MRYYSPFFPPLLLFAYYFSTRYFQAGMIKGIVHDVPNFLFVDFELGGIDCRFYDVTWETVRVEAKYARLRVAMEGMRTCVEAGKRITSY